MDKVLITGTTSGLGASLSKVYNDNNYDVHSISRSDPGHLHWTVHRFCDLKKLDQVEETIRRCVETNHYKYVFLNAGTLGDLSPSSQISLHDYQEAFNINVWSNKIIIDNLIRNSKADNIISISSGAASKGYFGWSLYCTTKATMKQLISCYSLEYPETNFLSLAPGLVKTKMQDLINIYDPKEIPSVQKFQEAYDDMQTPEQCANKIFHNLDSILSTDVDFFDLRSLQEESE